MAKNLMDAMDVIVLIYSVLIIILPKKLLPDKHKGGSWQWWQ